MLVATDFIELSNFLLILNNLYRIKKFFFVDKTRLRNSVICDQSTKCRIRAEISH